MTPENEGSPHQVIRWVLLSVEAPPPSEAIQLAEALRRLGARALDRRQGRVLAWIPDPPSPEELLRQAELAVRTHTSLTGARMRLRWCSPADMEREWRAGSGLIRTGARTRIALSEEEVEVSEDWVLVRLRPGPAFGDGSHPTTRSSVAMLERLVGPGDRVADVGSGSGVLAIAAVLLGADRVLAFESDEVAARVAEENIRLNRVQDRVQLHHLEVGPQDLAAMGSFQGIVANLEPGILLPLAEGFGSALADDDGWLVVSGVPRGERAAVLHGLEGHGLALDVENLSQGWWTGVFRPLGDAL